jgi:hypothetical protein
MGICHVVARSASSYREDTIVIDVPEFINHYGSPLPTYLATETRRLLA